jgi:hypothetical protein
MSAMPRLWWAELLIGLAAFGMVLALVKWAL